MILPTRRWRVFYFQETSMSSNFERSQQTKVMISSAPVTAETLSSASFLELSCTIKEVQFTAGQKQDIDVTTLCSTEQENINGLGAASEISMSGNFYLNAAQNALRSAYDNDTTYGFKVIFRQEMDLPLWQKFASIPGLWEPTVLLLPHFPCA